ncbi:MAG: hypothetical protein K2L18_07415, partial [Acetatifactor sp.]|nr:hypothetical protein [Acetatifactor sp.]
GYIKKSGDVIKPNVVVFNHNAEESDSAEPEARLTALRNEILALFMRAPSISRAYVIEQALEDGWIAYDENTINTIGAYIYL